MCACAGAAGVMTCRFVASLDPRGRACRGRCHAEAGPFEWRRETHVLAGHVRPRRAHACEPMNSRARRKSLPRASHRVKTTGSSGTRRTVVQRRCLSIPLSQAPTVMGSHRSVAALGVSLTHSRATPRRTNGDIRITKPRIARAKLGRSYATRRAPYSDGPENRRKTGTPGPAGGPGVRGLTHRTRLPAVRGVLSGCTGRSRTPPAARPRRCRSRRCSRSWSRRSRRPCTSRPSPPRSARPGCCGTAAYRYRPG